MRAQRRDGDRAPSQLGERQDPREHQRVRDSPVQIEMIDRAVRAVPRVVTLRRRELHVPLDRTVPACGGKHALRAIERVRLDQHVRIDAGSEVRRRVHGVGQAGPFHQQCIDASRRKRFQKIADRLRGSDVERRRHPKLASEVRGLRIRSLVSRQRVRHQEVHAMPARGRNHIARQSAPASPADARRRHRSSPEAADTI